MSSQDLSADLLAFIDASIPSIWALETLILLREEPGRTWTPEALVTALRASDPLVAGTLAVLEKSGLVVPDGGGFIYRPATPALERLCGRLQDVYRERPVRVMSAITQRRANPLKGFADAFRFRGVKP